MEGHPLSCHDCVRAGGGGGGGGEAGEGGAEREEGPVRGRAAMGLGADRAWKVRARDVYEGCVQAGGGVPVGPLWPRREHTHSAAQALLARTPVPGR